MADRAELLEAVLDNLPDGVGLLGENCEVVFWNQAAQAITGFPALDLVGRPAPEELKPLLEGCCPAAAAESTACPIGSPGCYPAGTSSDQSHETGRGFVVQARHKLGHDFSAMTRLLVLRDAMRRRIGTAILFHPTECLDALAHGETGESTDIEASQEDLKGRLESLIEDSAEGGLEFGVLWITVDQAHELRQTHGAGACEDMFKKVERVLAQGLRPAEYLGRWGEDEFLVISHERTPANLATHAQVLAGLARTADFRWWGDRISLTVSIGAAQAENAGTLAELLDRAKTAMVSSHHAGGNHITRAPEEHSCSPS